MSYLHALARQLGGEVSGKGRINCPGPGHTPRDRSLSVTFNEDGTFVCYSHAGDDWRACRDHVSRILNLDATPPTPVVPAVAAVPKASADDAISTAAALRIWEASGPPGAIVRAYLANRGLEMPSELEAGDVIRFHGRCPFRMDNGKLGYLPAMVALFRDVVTNEPKAIHRTALEPDGSGKSRKLTDPKKMRGPVGGCAIKLSPDEEVLEGIAIAEGIENAITAMCGGLRPVWALGSAGAIKAFPVLNGVEAITILADHDATGIGAARACAQRWADEGREAVITYPFRKGADWNDEVAA